MVVLLPCHEQSHLNFVVTPNLCTCDTGVGSVVLHFVKDAHF